MKMPTLEIRGRFTDGTPRYYLIATEHGESPYGGDVQPGQVFAGVFGSRQQALQWWRKYERATQAVSE